MIILPAIDLYEKKAVRLLRGDYDKMTVYSNDPVSVARSFSASGAKYMHLVDLEGARDGNTANIDVISDIVSSTDMRVEVGGGIRSPETVRKYIDIGVERVILGTAALTDRDFLYDMVSKYGERIAVGVDIKDGFVAIKGWREVSDKDCFDFCSELESIGVKTVIVTDISKDGVLGGTNRVLYNELCMRFGMNFIASGGVSSLDDIRALADLGIYGAILGKALYTGTLDLKEGLKTAGRIGL